MRNEKQPATVLKRLQEQRKELENLLLVKSVVFNKVDKKFNYDTSDYSKGVQSDIVELFSIQKTPYTIGLAYNNIFDKDKAYITVSLTKELPRGQKEFVVSSFFTFADFKPLFKEFIATLSKLDGRKAVQAHAVSIFTEIFKQDKKAKDSLKDKCLADINAIDVKEVKTSLSSISKSIDDVQLKVSKIDLDILSLKDSLGITELEALLAEKYATLQTEMKNKINFVDKELQKIDTDIKQTTVSVKNKSKQLLNIRSTYPVVIGDFNQEFKKAESILNSLWSEVSSKNSKNTQLMLNIHSFKKETKL